MRHDSLCREPAPSISPSDLVGCWVEEVSRSHAYVADIHGQLVAPYCYSGNEELSGMYYDWRPVNDLYYARFRWRHDAIEGFSFLSPRGDHYPWFVFPK